MSERKKIYINGQWVEGTAEAVLSSVNPATGEVLAETRECSESDVCAAIGAAKESFYGTREWRDMDSQRKSDVLLKIASLIRGKGRRDRKNRIAGQRKTLSGSDCGCGGRRELLSILCRACTKRVTEIRRCGI